MIIIAPKQLTTHLQGKRHVVAVPTCTAPRRLSSRHRPQRNKQSRLAGIPVIRLHLTRSAPFACMHRQPSSIHAPRVLQNPLQTSWCSVPAGWVLRAQNYGDAYDNLFKSSVFQSEMVVREFDRFVQELLLALNCWQSRGSSKQLTC